MLKRILWSVVVFLVTWFVIWALAYVLIATNVAPLVEVGAFLDRIDWLAGLVAGVVYFFTGENWLRKL